MSKLTFHNFSSIKESKEFVYANFSHPKKQSYALKVFGNQVNFKILTLSSECDQSWVHLAKFALALYLFMDFVCDIPSQQGQAGDIVLTQYWKTSGSITRGTKKLSPYSLFGHNGFNFHPYLPSFISN